MIHSFEIQYPLSSYAASYCIFRLNYPRRVSKLIPDFKINLWNKERVNSFFEQPKDKSCRLLIDDDIKTKYPGILKIVLLHTYNKEYIGEQYFIRMKINPCSLLLGYYSENLFHCSFRNNENLQNAYAKFIFNLFPRAFIEPIPLNYDRCLKTEEYVINKITGEKTYLSEWLEKFRTLAALPYLGLASVKRVDYAKNHKLPKNFQLFLMLAKRSAIDRRKKVLFPDNREKLELINKSKTLAVYEKVKVTDDDFSTKEIVRIKTILRSPSKEWKRNNLKINSEKDAVKLYKNVRGGLLPFLDESVAETVIKVELDKLVGPGDFYSTYRAWKIIDESKYKKDKKQNLKDLMQLVSQCWSVQKAEKQYIVGAPLKKSRKIVKGSQQTFRKSIKQLRELGVQPLRILDSWHLSHLHNPINDDVSRIILFGPEPLNQLLSKETLIKYEDTKTEIKEMLEARRIK